MSHRARADDSRAPHADPDEHDEQASTFVGDAVKIVTLSRAAEFDAIEERFFRFRVLDAVFEVFPYVAVVPLEFGNVHQDSPAIHCIYKSKSVNSPLHRTRAIMVEMRRFVRRLPFGGAGGAERGERDENETDEINEGIQAQLHQISCSHSTSACRKNEMRKSDRLQGLPVRS